MTEVSNSDWGQHMTVTRVGIIDCGFGLWVLNKNIETAECRFGMATFTDKLTNECKQNLE